MSISTHYQTTTCLLRFYDSIGPILLSVLSVFVTFSLLQPIALRLDPTFSLLATRGIGKIAITIIALIHILMLSATVSKQWFARFTHTNFYFFKERWAKTFWSYFIYFFGIHTLLLLTLSGTTSIMRVNPEALWKIPYKFPSILWGLVATFFLAWTEEAIFRGTLFPFLQQKLSTFSSIMLTSLIFTLSHNLTNPLALVTYKWKLGLGLFLLGAFLNLCFFTSKKLYLGMGIHAGLVYVKVFLRRIPFLEYSSTFPWWFNSDLRQSVLVHLLFLLSITIVLLLSKKRFQN